MLFLAETFRIQVSASWIVFTYIGTLAVVFRAGPVGWAVDHYGEVSVARLGLVVLALGLLLLPLMPTLFTVAGALALIPIGAAFTFPCLTALLLHLLAPAERGMYMGLQQTVGGITRVVIPLWAGFAYDHFGHGLPFWTVAALVGGVGVLGMRCTPVDQLLSK